LLLAVAVYTLVVALAPGASLWDWLNTLFATVLSVAAALVVGLALFEYQTGETDRRQKEELVRLLEAELGEIVRGMRERPSEFNSWVHDRDTFAPLQFTARLEQHHPNPLIAEEAVKSGLFGAEATAKLLVLSRLMRAIPIADSLARRHARWSGEVDELRGAALDGMLEAWGKHDPDGPIPFRKLAAKYMKWRVRDRLDQLKRDPTTTNHGLSSAPRFVREYLDAGGADEDLDSA
jgi:hypothetical protein